MKWDFFSNISHTTARKIFITYINGAVFISLKVHVEKYLVSKLERSIASCILSDMSIGSISIAEL